MCCQKDLRLIIQSHSLFCTKPCLWLQEWCACAVVMQTATDYCLLVHLRLHRGGSYSNEGALFCSSHMCRFEVPIKGRLGMLISFLVVNLTLTSIVILLKFHMETYILSSWVTQIKQMNSIFLFRLLHPLRRVST